MRKTNQRTDRLGVLKLGAFFAKVGWLFREQLNDDYGIDAQVEIADGHNALGALIGIQIKSGASYFAEQTDSSIIFRSNDKHIKYWLRHLLPVIVVLYDDERDILYWEVISEETIKPTGKDWRVDVPKENILSKESLVKLKALTQPPPNTRRLNSLRLDRAWIDLVAQGEVVYVEFEDWVNKSLPRFTVTIGCDTREDISSQRWPTTYAPGLSIGDFLTHLLPWADFKMDEDAYESFMEDQWMNECYSGHDNETGQNYYSMPFSEYYTPPDGIVPVSEDGETEGYRLILELNELGKALIIVDDYLSDEDDFEDRTFTL
jgi:hypothetical protein